MAPKIRLLTSAATADLLACATGCETEIFDGGAYSELPGHSDEARQRMGFHFFHHSAALDFDSDLGRPQFSGDLFVEQALHDQGHDFLLARRQRTVAGVQ